MRCCRSQSAWIRIYLIVVDPDLGAWKLTKKVKNLVSCLLKRPLYLRRFFFDLLGLGTYFRHIFYLKISFLDLDPDSDPRGSALVWHSWIRIRFRMEIKSWIHGYALKLMRIPHHWCKHVS